MDSAPLHQISFNRDIRPILADTCWHCHGPGREEGGVRFDLRENATVESESGVIPIVPGEPNSSEAIRRVFSDDSSEQMPPPDSNKVLTAEQKEIIRRWIAEGAEYESHWAYCPLRRPVVPGASGHPVDRFVKTGLDISGFDFNVEARPALLLRRLSFDLTGLPPSPEEIGAFVSGAESYDQAVDRLLASPRFAERQSQYWLDAVRFADTRGFHSDEEFPIWPYRDYVLHAFDDNLPFDTFTREQLAGDLLPGATPQQKVASAFNRLNRTSVESGIQEKEYLAKYGADRVRTVGTVWLGQTIGCAECHDHKYDPIKQLDFYALKAFFAELKYPGATGGQLDLPSEAQSRRLASLAERIARAKSELTAIAETLQSQRPAIERQMLDDSAHESLEWIFQKPLSAHATNGAQLKVYSDQLIDSEFVHDSSQYVRRWIGNGIVEATGANPDASTYEVRIRPGRGRWAQLGLEVFADARLPGNIRARGNETFFLSSLEVVCEKRVGSAGTPIDLCDAVDDASASGPSCFGPLAAIDDSDETSWSASPSQPILGNRFLAVRFAEDLNTSASDILVVRLKHESPQRQATIGRFRIALANDVRCWPAPTPLSWMVGPSVADRQAGNAPPRRTPGITNELKRAIETVENKRSGEQAALVHTWFNASQPQTRSAWKRFELLRTQRENLRAQIPACLVSDQADQPLTTRVLPRGDWMDDTGEIVAPAIPQYLGQLKLANRRPTRLDLANWIVSDENPLTARVVVNRLWAQFFGTGISRTLDDFGSQGDWPTHPELLDWLACEFKEPTWQAAGSHRWDLKHIVRLIVTSRTYRQSSVPTPRLLEQDPENRLLASQNRHRLDAEAIRDQALAASGLLREHFGGSSVRPYQAPGYLTSLNFPRRDYPTSRGSDLWRRSLYTFCQRTFPHPTMMVFDACSREESQVSRAVSNTPLQSLVLLNDPTFVEAARVLAQSIAESDRNVESQIDEAFFRVLSRRPNQHEHEALRVLYSEARSQFEQDGSSNAFLSVGDAPSSSVNIAPAELAALAATTRAIMNLHEAITRN